MTPQAIKPFTGPLPDAHAHARAQREPVFVAASIFADDRGWSVMNQLQGVMTPEGQVNYSVMYPQVIKAWHRHVHQTDFWMCVMGHLKVGIYREEDNTAWLAILGEKRPGLVIIPPGLWHGGATISHEPAGLLYYVTHAFNAKQPDEARRAYDSVEGFPWGVRHG